MARQVRFIAPGRSIDDRPEIVGDRTRLGDWEGDLIVGRMSRSAIGTLVDRRSGYVQLVHLPAGHSAAALRSAMTSTLQRLTASQRQTLTWDQGSEMAEHNLIDHLFTDGTFFAHPGSPWLRGSNENTNRLLRQYFPKGSDLSVHTEADLHAIADRLNTRPRKRLNWRTPQADFETPLAS